MAFSHGYGQIPPEQYSIEAIRNAYAHGCSFFENNAEALAGKTLIPFSTHEGSGLSGFDKKLAAACPNSIVGEGLAIRGNDCQNDKEGVRQRVTDWLSGLR